MNIRTSTILNASFILLIVAINDVLWLRIAWATIGILLLIIQMKALRRDTAKQVLLSLDGRIAARLHKQRKEDDDGDRQHHQVPN